MNKHLSWTTDLTKEFPSECFTEKGLSQNGYHIDKDAIEIQFGLWKQLNKIVYERKRPFPRCTQIVPRAVANWNKKKVFVDVLSRLLSHIKIPFKKANPVLQITMRYLLYMIANGHLSTQYTQMDNTFLRIQR